MRMPAVATNFIIGGGQVDQSDNLPCAAKIAVAASQTTTKNAVPIIHNHVTDGSSPKFGPARQAARMKRPAKTATIATKKTVVPSGMTGSTDAVYPAIRGLSIARCAKFSRLSS